MRTRGCLDVDRESSAVTSFMCTNTVVTEEEGKQLIKLMKRKFTLLVNNKEGPTIQEIEDETNDKAENEDEPAPVEDPKRLEQVILHLVTNLPSPSPQLSEDESMAAASPERKSMSPRRLTIIPPNKERIVSAIEKIYGIKNFPRDPIHEENYKQTSAAGSIDNTPQYLHAVEVNSTPAAEEAHRVRQEAQIVPYQSAHVSSYVQAPDSCLVPPVAENYSDNDYSEDTHNALASPDLGYLDFSQSPFSNIYSIFANLQNGEEFFNENQMANMQKYEYQGTEMGENMPVPQYADEPNVSQALPQATLSNLFPCGTKRPNDFEDSDMVYKKKITETECFRQNEPASDLEFVQRNEPTSDLEFLHQNESTGGSELFVQNKPTTDLDVVQQNETNPNVECSQQNKPPSDVELDQQSESSPDSFLDLFSDESIFDSDQIELAVSKMECMDTTLPNLQRTDVKQILDEIEKEAEQEQRLRDFNLADYE